MTYFLYEVVNGRICGESTELPSEMPDGVDYIFSELPSFSGAAHYVASGAVVALPPKPNQYCIFDYDTKQWVDPRTPETQWPIVRSERNQKLQACDWTQLADIAAETKALWEPYRQALRDVTNQPDPFNIVWPTPPTA